MIFNLNSPSEDDEHILSSIISLIGDMCLHLNKLQKQRYVIDTGTYNLIHIMTKMSQLKFRLEATIAIRKATRCRQMELLDAFVANGLIESVVAILDDFGHDLLQSIEKKD